MGLGPGLRPSGPRAVPSTILCPLPDSPMNVRSSTHLIRAVTDASRQRRSPERDHNIKPTIGASGRKLASSNVYKRKDRTPTLDQPNLKTTPLHALHQDLGARMVPFAGYEMPVQYPLGVLKEHLHTRAAAGLLDISLMGQMALFPR